MQKEEPFKKGIHSKIKTTERCQFCHELFIGNEISAHEYNCNSKYHMANEQNEDDINDFSNYSDYTCIICNENVNFMERENHKESCKQNSATLACTICNKKILIEIIEQHEESCVNFNPNIKGEVIDNQTLLECLTCKFKYPVLRIDHHEMRCNKVNSYKKYFENLYQIVKDSYVINNHLIAKEKPQLVNLESYSDEYLYVSEFLFKSSLEEDKLRELFEITSIKKVINPRVMLRYEDEKERINKKLNRESEDEWLFHSINNYTNSMEPEDICLEPLAFEIDYCKTLFLGKGLYFHENFLDAVNYDNSQFNYHENQSVILSKVLIGNNKIMNEADKNLKASSMYKMDYGQMYDSILAMVPKLPEVYIFYEENKVVPCYLINYYCKQTNDSDAIPQLYSLHMNNIDYSKIKSNKKNKN